MEHTTPPSLQLLLRCKTFFNKNEQLWRTEVTRTHTYWHTRTQSRHWLDLCSLRCRLIVSLYKHGCLTVSLTEYMYMISTVMVCSCTELRSCVRVLVAVLGSPSVTVLMVFVDVKQHLNVYMHLHSLHDIEIVQIAFLCAWYLVMWWPRYISLRYY